MSKKQDGVFSADEANEDNYSMLPDENVGGIPAPSDIEVTEPFKPMPGTRNLSGEFIPVDGMRGQYDDYVTGERIFIELVDTERFAVIVIARDKKRARLMRNRVHDDVDDVSDTNFFAIRGWNIARVDTGHDEDGMPSKLVITIVQTGL